MIIARIRYLFISSPSKNFSQSVGVPYLAKTAPKKFDAATKTMIKAVISNVFDYALCSLGKVGFLYAEKKGEAA
jgi:hypothetical protein